MYLRRSATVKYLLAAYVGAALYCEWFVYYIQPVHWPALECQSTDHSCTKVLFIGDPQIQGEYGAPPPFNYLFSWDADRYLKATFTIAVRHFKPDVLVFLGDLTDEGSICTMPQFHGYVKRLSNIFEVKYPVMQVWLPGDNDIGGENEPIKHSKIIEFEKVFDQPSILTHKNVTFYKVNGITHTLPNTSDLSQLKDDFKIVVSHYPITMKTGFGSQVNREIHPDIYFCAHDHESKYVKQDSNLSNREKHPIKYGDKVLDIVFTKEVLYEIYVPTCSYRMGTSRIGYGAAILENNNQRMRYTVLWSPTRFPFLILYAALLIFVIIYFIAFCAARLFFRCSKTAARTTRSSDKVPLLEKV